MSKCYRLPLDITFTPSPRENNGDYTTCHQVEEPQFGYIYFAKVTKHLQLFSPSTKRYSHLAILLSFSWEMFRQAIFLISARSYFHC